MIVTRLPLRLSGRSPQPDELELDHPCGMLDPHNSVVVRTRPEEISGSEATAFVYRRRWRVDLHAKIVHVVRLSYVRYLYIPHAVLHDIRRLLRQ